MAETPSHLERLIAEADAAPAAPAIRKKRKGLRNTLIVLGSLVVLLAIAAGVAYAVLANSFNDINRVSIAQDPTLTRPEAVTVKPGAKAPINILLLGSDSRDTSDPTASVEEATGFRSDAILVAQVSPDRKNLTVMSIMRDNWVPIQDHGEAKINAAVALGGMPLAVNTVENFIGARIDHVALVDFSSFTKLTDALGGVTVNNTQPFTSTHGGHAFAPGKITLTGEEALGFVRERYAFADGDYQRARNQQAYLKGLMQGLLSKDTMTDPGKLTSTFQALKPYLVLDNDLDLQNAVSLGFDLRSIRSSDIQFFTSPTLGTGTSADGQSIVVPDPSALADVTAAFQGGTLNEYAATRAPGSELPQ
ncbi:Cell envelope-associated transcriptional attenuator LytR-CpsA-Psr, subfamily A1 (as in PMID19099556) [Leucobacter sp. 7(1)]|uniref:LCP family protein n=1 Tax=Leucobacter sp. 7(1) TaxID=1255613 RepID=UPI00097EF053|nr:LCP family protein [Leucobacter sp. 7(1)]SJN11862.1 Cell envelope-associated transcriptional attenuator LytR-CpsA-Psr, subfamily A1 (as in PMID19099556) [Leucobacter sp. 7(1)]